MARLRGLITALLVACSLSGIAQDEVIDSLNTVLKSTIADSVRVKALLELCGQYYRIDANKAEQLAIEAKEWSESSGYKNGLALSYKAIGMSYYYRNNWIEALYNWKLALETFKSNNDMNGVSNMLNNLGAVYFNGGDDKAALDNYLEALRVAESNKDSLRTVSALVNIGTVYLTKESSKDLAMKYYMRAIPLSRALNDYDVFGTCAVNVGELYLRNANKADSLKYFKPDSALYYFEAALDAYRHTTTGNIPVALKNIGKVYMLRNEFDKAIQYQTEAYQVALAMDAKLEMAQALSSLADTYVRKGDIKQAIARYDQAKELAQEIDALFEMEDAYLGLARSYSKATDFKQAYQYLNLYTEMKDTLYNAEMDKKLQAQTLSYEIEKKEGQINLLEKDQELRSLEIKRQKAIRNGTIAFGLLFLALAVGMFNRYRFTKRTNKIISQEKERSEQLLLNILPAEVAEELKEKGEAEARLINQVTVLFTDFKGFTAMSEKVTPKQLVRDLHECFSYFDRICEQFGMEKIKTIGDAYMAVGGLPVENSTHATDALNVAMAMRDFIAEGKARKIAAGLPYFEIRIGIHTGPVVAGIVGVKKFQYDIWGDTVNTASRMESSGEAGKVNISEASYELVKDDPSFQFVARGKVQAKGKGEMEMYFVDRVA